jgi:MipA family protein
MGGFAIDACAHRASLAGLLSVALVANLPLCMAVQGQPAFDGPFFSPSGLWTVQIGAAGASKPDFEGADHYALSGTPIFFIQRAGFGYMFRSPRDGASFGLFDIDGFRAGPVARFTPARTARGYSELNGLGNVKFAIEFGGFAEYFPTDWFRARVEVREGFLGHQGVTADFSTDVIVPLLERFSVSGGPRFTLEDTKATSPYFGVNSTQSIASGLPVYEATGGMHSVGAGTQLRYQIGPQWEAHSYIEYDRLVGSAATSPIVTMRGSPNQITAGLGASYTTSRAD